MTTPTTPLFDQLEESVKLLSSKTNYLFLNVDGDFRHPDLFVYLLSASRILDEKKAGMIPHFTLGHFMRMVKWRQGLPDYDLLRKEITRTLASFTTQRQEELFFTELNLTCTHIWDITDFLMYKLPLVKDQWIEKIKRAIEITSDELWVEEYMSRTDADEFDVKYQRDSMWPYALLFLESIEALTTPIYTYLLILRDFSNWQSKASQSSTIVIDATLVEKPAISVPPASNEPVYKTFTDLFINPEDVEPWGVLTELCQPLG